MVMAASKTQTSWPNGTNSLKGTVVMFRQDIQIPLSRTTK